MTDSLAILAKTGGMSPKVAKQWEELSAAVITARLNGHPTAVDDLLVKESSKMKGHPLMLAYGSWRAENLLRVGQSRLAIDALDETIKHADPHRGGVLPFDPLVTLLRLRADAMLWTGDAEVAISGSIDLASESNTLHPAFDLQVAQTAEGFGKRALAEKWYERALSATMSSEGANYRVRSTVEGTPAHYRETARRCLERLRLRPDAAQSPEGLAQALADAVHENDYKALARLASRTHFRIELGCHSVFVDLEKTLELLFGALGTAVPGPFKLITNGAHRQLNLGIEEVGHPLRFGALVLRKHARGWEWSGLRVGDRDYWLSDFPSAPVETNQPLSIRIRGPWLTGRKFMAGGFRHPWHGFAADLSLDPISMVIRSCSSDCGFGVRGFYYNEAISHNGISAFAIDFSSYEQCVPFSDRANLWPVLAPADGIVVGTRITVPNGSDSDPNVVELIHPFGVPICRYLSRYLHLAGSPSVPVSTGMFVRGGTVLGFMDDTGNSATPHLHFSIHDQSIGPHPDLVTSSVSFPIMFGPSVRPTPMAGQRLDDADDGRCVDSRNAGVLPTVRVIVP